MTSKKIDDRAPARRLRPLLTGALVATSLVAAAVLTGPAAAPAVPPDRPMSLAELQLEAFTGKATIEMVLSGGNPKLTGGRLPQGIKGENPDGSIALGTVRWGIKQRAFDPITITKNVDSATTVLQLAAVTGLDAGTAAISIKPANSNLGPDTSRWPLHLTLVGVHITSDGMTASAATPTTELPPDPETVTMTTSKIKFSYQDPSGSPVQQFQWDLSTNSPG